MPEVYGRRLQKGRRPVYARLFTRDGGSTMAHAKDKGAKNVKKKAAKGIKEKRAEKKLKHDGRRQSGAVETIGERN
jgi:hypothetical protein